MTAPLKKILIVDDEPSLRDVLEDLIEHLGYSAESVESGKLALEKLSIKKFDLIIIDIVMPEMDGIELLGYIKKDYPALPVLMIAAYKKFKESETSLLNSVNGFLVKPFKMEEIDSELKRIIG